ncbi:Esterase/lipase [Olavius algarvensis Delta 1 endosymbiont]|nr:Esterase/lipase [Olavius algarvensis Delta 1 endosymbiont]
MSLDPQVVKILEEAQSLGLPDYQDLSPTEARQQMRDHAPPVQPNLAVEKVVGRTIPGPEGNIPIRLYYPAGDGLFPTVVYFHGGGWVIGDLETHHAFCHALAKSSGCLVVAVDYRLAPEHRYPAAVEDAYAATKWVAENAETIQADPDRFAVCGDSAGGHLAAVVSMMARDRKGPGIDLQILIYPITDCRFDTPSYDENREGYMLTRDLMKWFWNYFINDESEADDPYVSPLRAKDLSGLPPALILTAGYDPLRDEGEAYGRRLQEAGVNVTLSRYPGMIHAFIRMTAVLDKANEALGEVAGMLKVAFKIR